LSQHTIYSPYVLGKPGFRAGCDAVYADGATMLLRWSTPAQQSPVPDGSRQARVSWFRSSPHFDIELGANSGIKTTLEIKELPVSFDSEIRSAADIELMRISESGH